MKLKGRTEIKKDVQIVSSANSSLKISLTTDKETQRSKKSILKDLKEAFIEVKEIKNGQRKEAKSFSALLDEI
ncbi:MAG: hypothetical protein AABZ74_14920 [Cyanobacteriota bacterium]